MYLHLELYEDDVKGHVTVIVTLYAVIMFEGHVTSCSEWTLVDCAKASFEKLYVSQKK